MAEGSSCSLDSPRGGDRSCRWMAGCKGAVVLMMQGRRLRLPGRSVIPQSQASRIMGSQNPRRAYTDNPRTTTDRIIALIQHLAEVEPWSGRDRGLRAGVSPAAVGDSTVTRLRADSSPLPPALSLPASSEHACDPARECHRYGLALFSPRPHVVGPPDRCRSKPGDRFGKVLPPRPPSGLRSGGAEDLGDLGDSGKIEGRSSGRHACQIDTLR